MGVPEAQPAICVPEVVTMPLPLTRDKCQPEALLRLAGLVFPDSGCHGWEVNFPNYRVGPQRAP